MADHGVALTNSASRQAGIAIGSAGAAWLLLATALSTTGLDYGRLGAYRRLWSDLAVAIASYLEPAGPPAGAPRPNAEAAGRRDPNRACARPLLASVRREGVKPWQFWRTVPPEPFRRLGLRPEPRPYDDDGRPKLLALGFRLLGGISPFLISWLGALLCAPVLFWIAWEFADAGHPVAAAVFLGVLGLSSFFVKTLALTRYAVGFYLVGLLLIVPLAAYGVMNARPTLRGLLVRALLASGAFAIASACRSSVGLVLPGVLLAVFLGLRRTTGPGWKRRAAFGAILLLFLAWYPAMGRSQGHDVWQPLWEGLGDFDRSKGYTWSDEVAEQAAQAAGAPGLWTPESEAFFRASILRDVRSDPAWFAGILWKRLTATALLTKLWPWEPGDGPSMALGDSDNEGAMDKYYSYAPTADRFQLGRRQVEAPVWALLLPTLLLGVLAGAPTALLGEERRRGIRALLGVLACLALGALALPVLITTAGGQEPQALALAYLLGLAGLAEWAWSYRRR